MIIMLLMGVTVMLLLIAGFPIALVLGTTVAAVATLDPLTAENTALTEIFACSKPPGRNLRSFATES